MPDKLETKINEKSSNISGGERQRIILARALLRRAKVYIFDESTSALDIETEYRILSNIKEFLQDSILIFITHRDTSQGLFDKEYKIIEGNSYEYK